MRAEAKYRTTESDAESGLASLPQEGISTGEMQGEDSTPGEFFTRTGCSILVSAPVVFSSALSPPIETPINNENSDTNQNLNFVIFTIL